MNHYSTSDLGLAAYLLYEGMTLLGTVETADPKRHALYFVDDDSRKDWELNYMGGKAEVKAKRYSYCVHKVAKELRNPVGRNK